VRFIVSPRDLSRVRFAISPLWECVASLFVLADETRAVMHRGWLNARAEMPKDDLELLTGLVRPHGYIPDFLTPPPDEPFPTFQRELERLQATSAKWVHEEILKMWGFERFVPDAVKPVLEHPKIALPRVVAALERHWASALEPHWGRVRALLEADVNERSKVLALSGAAAMLNSVNPRLSYDGGILERLNSSHMTVKLGGRGLLLLPSVFTTPHVKGIDAPNYQPTIIYPANGALTLWGEPVTNDQLEALLGAQTARVLTLLHAPRTTRELALHLHLPESGASYHLSKLREAGLLESQRRGRLVYHARSSRGEALVELFA
jgi:hypothetical protein